MKLQLQVTSGGQGNTVSVSLNHFSYFQLPDYYLVHSKFSHSFFYRHHSEISPTVQGFLFKICDMDYGGPLTNYMDRCYVILYTIEGRKKKKKITVSTFKLVVAWQSYPKTKNKENMKISKVVSYDDNTLNINSNRSSHYLQILELDFR